jgi:hypothetical protein
MLCDIELRERLSDYCLITKQTQEKAANVAIREMLDRVDADPTMKSRIDRAKTLKAELEALFVEVK